MAAENNGYDHKNKGEQAGAELCQAQTSLIYLQTSSSFS